MRGGVGGGGATRVNFFELSKICFYTRESIVTCRKVFGGTATGPMGEQETQGLDVVQDSVNSQYMISEFKFRQKRQKMNIGQLERRGKAGKVNSPFVNTDRNDTARLCSK